MDPNLPPNPAPNINQPPPGNQSLQKNRTILILALVFLILVTLIAGVYFGKSYFIKKQPAAQPTPKQSNTLTGLEIAKKTAMFLDNSVLPDGDYYGAYQCDSQTPPQDHICKKAIDNSKSLSTRVGYIALAYLDLYKATRDISYKEKADKTLAFVLKGCTEKVDFCHYSMPAFYAWYKDTGDNRYKEAMIKASNTILAQKSLNERVVRNEGGMLWMLYDATGDKKYLDILVQTSDNMLKGGFDLKDDRSLFRPFYQEGDFEVREYLLWVAGDWYIPAFKATKNLVYLQAAQDFFDKARIDAHTEDFKKRLQAPDLNALEYLLDLAEVSDEPKKSNYLAQAGKFAQATIPDIWDNPENKKFVGDYGFLFFHISYPDKDKNRKITFHSAWRIRQLLKLSTTSFKLL